MKRLLGSLGGLFIWLGATNCMADVEIAAYDVLQEDPNQRIELRNYPSLVLVSTPMERGRNRAFYRLFGYISGENTQRTKIAMTAPVFMGGASTEKGEKIAMTAPVFVGEQDGEATMSFVLPGSYTEEAAPLPDNPMVKLHSVRDYTVAAIRFSGTMSKRNINKHKAKLEQWVSDQGYRELGPYLSAGYNPPYTLPFMRRNEVLVPIDLAE